MFETTGQFFCLVGEFARLSGEFVETAWVSIVVEVGTTCLSIAAGVVVWLLVKVASESFGVRSPSPSVKTPEGAEEGPKNGNPRKKPGWV